MAHKGTKNKYIGRKVKANTKHTHPNELVTGKLIELLTGTEGTVYAVVVMVPKYYVVWEDSIRIK